MASLPADRLQERCRILLIRAIDRNWSEYLADMSDVRDGIHLRRFGRQDPLFEFNAIAIDHFASVISGAQEEALRDFRRLTDDTENTSPADDPMLHPSATWTYMVSDNPFEDDPDMQLFGNTGYSLFAGLLWPVTMLVLLLKRQRGKEK